MKWRSFLLGLGIGLVSGYAAKELLAEKSLQSADKVLDHAKRLFKEEGPISGSWIHMKAEPYEKGLLHYDVYKGGISRQQDDVTEQFEFIADAKTGTILEVFKLV
ncbi:PepSY domain-containing protein [Cytobacillus gottheilii]|uniref:PepSY domain-containing protein n=1 Tax=Cytobacillus gottheilii TaxID=859144 RepID=A0ABX8F8H5_9BACI|nr:PepSY domain-containing protein [Cytobacillus gottheilii]QVY60726.1 hypothetical protein J1899_17210 [Cytobacillus gottheilii]